MRSATRMAALLMLAGAALLPAAETSAPSSYEAPTLPSGDVTLSFVRPGRVTEMVVHEGDPVKAGQLVARQDDTEELALLEAAKSEAEDNTEIEAEKAVFAKDSNEYENLKGNAGTSTFEKNDARLKVVVDEARIKLAVTKKAQAQYKYESNKAGVEKLKLFSPIDGVVAKIFIKAGESTDSQSMKAMRVVQVDPLWIEVPVKVEEARRLKRGDPAQVIFKDKHVRTGKVALVFPVGDSAVETINVRVEVPNPEKLQPGENVRVSFVGEPGVAASPEASR